MTLKEKILYHQIHPAKLAADISASIVSGFFLWQRQFAVAMLGAFAPALIGSALVIKFADLERLKHSRFGRYIATYMTRPVEAWRFAGQVIMWIAAWRHNWPGIVAGALVVIAAWMSGLVRRPRVE